jgi:hypothetical protein
VNSIAPPPPGERTPLPSDLELLVREECLAAAWIEQTEAPGARPSRLQRIATAVGALLPLCAIVLLLSGAALATSSFHDPTPAAQPRRSGASSILLASGTPVAFAYAPVHVLYLADSAEGAALVERAEAEALAASLGVPGSRQHRSYSVLLVDAPEKALQADWHVGEISRELGQVGDSLLQVVDLRQVMR